MLPLLSLIDFRFQGSFIPQLAISILSVLYTPRRYMSTCLFYMEHTQKNFLIYEFTFCTSDVML